MYRRSRTTAPLLLVGVAIGVGVFIAGAHSSLGLTLFGRVVLLLVLPVSVLFGVYGLKHQPTFTLVILLGIFVRLPRFTAVPTIDDGDFYLAAAFQLLNGGVEDLGHIGSIAIWAIFVTLFDHSALNVTSFVFSIATIPLVGMIGWRLFESRLAALGGMTAFALSPIAIYYSSKAINEPLALFFLALAISLVLVDRQYLALVVTGMLVFMRIEYALLLLAPYVVIRATSYRSIRLGVLTLPVLSVGLVLLSAVAGTKVPLWRTFAGLLEEIDLFSRYSIWLLLVNPRDVLIDRYQGLASHMVHWGVPYWNAVLVNPAIPITAITGVVLGSQRRRRMAFSGGLTLLGFALVFVQGELAQGELVFSLVTIAISLGTYTLFAYFVIDDGISIDHLFLSTYVYSIGILVLPPAPRYFLPIVLVYSVYAGRAVEFALNGAANYASD